MAKNFRSPWGEIDLIASRPGELHFVEVRSRATDTFLSPEQSVDAGKRARLRRTAEAWLAKAPSPDAQVFFDVASVVGDRIDLLVGAFD